MTRDSLRNIWRETLKIQKRTCNTVLTILSLHFSCRIEYTAHRGDVFGQEVPADGVIEEHVAERVRKSFFVAHPAVHQDMDDTGCERITRAHAVEYLHFICVRFIYAVLRGNPRPHRHG